MMLLEGREKLPSCVLGTTEVLGGYGIGKDHPLGLQKDGLF